MVQLLLSSKTVIQEVPPSIGTIPALSTATAAAAGVTEMGPMEARRVASLEEWNTLYGGHTANAQDMPNFVELFFDNGGQELWTKRVTHFSDLLNANSNTAVKGTVTLNTQAGGSASAAVIPATNNGPYALSDGDILAVAVDGNAEVSATISASAASVTGSGATFASPTGTSFQARLNGGALQTINLDGTATDIDGALALINTQLVGGSAENDGGQVKINSDLEGTASSVEIVGGGSALTLLGLTATTNSGSGNVANVAAVTNSEIKTIVEAAISGLTVNVLAGGGFNLTSNTTGPSSSLQVSAGTSTTETIFGLITTLVNGAASAPDPTLRVDGKWFGAYANNFTVEIEAATNGQADSFNLTVLENGFVRESWPNLKIGSANSEDSRYVETVINDARTGSNIIAVADLLSVATPNTNVPVNGTFAMAGGDDGLTGLVDNDYLGNAASDTGLRGFDIVTGIRLLAVPGQATAAIHNGMTTYAETTRNLTMFPILDPPALQSAEDIVNYVETIASLLESTEFGAIYWPRLKTLNPDNSVYGNDPNIVVAPSGAVCGMIARTDNATLGGVYQPPAGVERGTLRGIVGLETDNNDALKETKRDLVFPKRINPIRTDPGVPFYVDGPLTLKSNGNFPTVAERRGVIHIEQTLKQAWEFARHSNNDAALRARVFRTGRRFLLSQTRVGAFRSRVPDEAFFLDVGDGLNTQDVIFSNRLLVRLGLATQKPALFVVVLVSQDTRALELELANAA